MLRQAFSDRLKEAMKARDSRTVSTVRLILAGLKERDVAARGQGNLDGLSEAEIQRMLQTMIKQRRESIPAARARSSGGCWDDANRSPATPSPVSLRSPPSCAVRESG